MTKEELEKEAEKHADGIYHYKINVSDYGEDGIINYRYSDIKEAYQKGAEPREKRIAELEQKLEQTEKDLADYQFNYPTIKELQKENAELKGIKDVATLIRANNDTVTTLMQLNNMLVSKTQQLTKARELLKQWLQTSRASGCDNINIVTDTEQFLNSKVEK